MLAYQCVQFGAPLEQRQVEKPTPTGHEVLVKTRATGICHTDVHVIDGDWGSCTLPRTPGHEGVGVVEAVGDQVKNLKVGDRVGVAWLNRSCMECDLCKEGKENTCENQIQTGFSLNGSFAEYFVADERFTIKIPDQLSDAAAAPIMCAGLTAYKAVKISEAKPGARIVIAGCAGGLGHLAVQYAKAMSYEVIALDFFDETSTKMLKDLGANEIVNLHEGDEKVHEILRQLRSKKPIEAAIIFAPPKKAVSDAVEYVSPGATIVAICLPRGNFEVDAMKFVLKQLRLQGSIVGTPRDLEEAFRYVCEGKVASHVVEKPFHSINEVVKDLKAGAVRGRCVLTFSVKN